MSKSPALTPIHSKAIEQAVRLARRDPDAKRLLFAAIDVICSVAPGDNDLVDSAWLSEIACAEPYLLSRLEEVCIRRGANRVAALAVRS